MDLDGPKQETGGKTETNGKTEAKATCGARCRDGHACRTDKVMPNGRCRMHGGKSRHGIGHPNFKHGMYSTCAVGVVLRVTAASARRRERVQAQYRELVKGGPVSSAEFRRLLKSAR